MKKGYLEKVNRAFSAVRAECKDEPGTGIILGSGLSGIADTFDGNVVPFETIPGFPKPTIAGHRGWLKINPRLTIMAGRFHYYEGNDIDDVVLPIFLLNRLGVKRVIITNASGGINPTFNPGDLVLIKDHINLMGVNPLAGPNDENLGPRFPDMSSAYSPALRALVRRASPELVLEGVYAALSGPCYETPAEIRMLKTIGADMVGMSTVPEVIVSRYLGMEVLGISCITNMAAGILEKPLDHGEVIETGKGVEKKFTRLLLGVIELMSRN
ncbi:MAG: purine-nucleoside phosphorylase [Spirochaetota bacterium]